MACERCCHGNLAMARVYTQVHKVCTFNGTWRLTRHCPLLEATPDIKILLSEVKRRGMLLEGRRGGVRGEKRGNGLRYDFRAESRESTDSIWEPSEALIFSTS